MNIPSKEKVLAILKAGINQSQVFIDKGLRKPITKKDLQDVLTYIEWSTDYNNQEKENKNG